MRFASTPARTLESAVAEEATAVTAFDNDGCGLVAIDLDGHEMRVLQGLRETLLQARSVWIEMMEETVEAISANDSICAWLSAHGFEPATLKSGAKGENRLFVNCKV